jgi:hypothetical protein
MTSSAPMFLSAIIDIASNTVASGETDQTAAPLLFKISPIVPVGIIAEVLLQFEGEVLEI